MCAPEDFELGEERAKVLRLVRELRELRGVSHDQVLAAVMASKTYKQIGAPALQDMNLAQAKAISRMLERWCDQAKVLPPKPKRETSAAPPAPWRERTNNHTAEGND